MLFQVRTIFITGLPEDVKERELQNLCRWLPGFEASQLNFKAEKPMGFALFNSPHQAIAAKDILQDMLFDPEAKSVLHTEMAKKNLFVKRGHSHSIQFLFYFYGTITSQIMSFSQIMSVSLIQFNHTISACSGWR